MTFSEWLETDRLGGYGLGTSDLVPTRRYHAFYTTPDPNSERRSVLLHTPLVEVLINGQWRGLSAFRFLDGAVHPDGQKNLVRFSATPWPTWEFEIDGCTLRSEFLLLHSEPAGFLRWSVVSSPHATLSLRFRPFLSMRDHHHLTAKHRYSEQPMTRDGNHYRWARDEESPAIHFASSATFITDALWFENFLYTEEQNRGYDYREDLFSPGYFETSEWRSSTTVKISPYPSHCDYGMEGVSLERVLAEQIDREAARRKKGGSLITQAAKDYLVRRNERATIIAGYPWFSDWGRDTFISIRGLGFALGNYEFAKEIILDWRDTVRDGLIPNRFPDTADEPEYNSIDATLWYLIAIGELLHHARQSKVSLTGAERTAILRTARSIIEKLAQGTWYEIRICDDGLVQAGVPGKQLTWMDAKIGDWVVTPRIGKPIEIQALWINALFLLERYVPHVSPLLARALVSFEEKFWSNDLGYLADVVDVDHRPGEMDFTFRPNQLFAIGGLPYSLVSRERALKILKKIEQHLLTPYGLRTMSPNDTRYHGHYRGDQATRDAAYHQGTVWPWLIGAYAEALYKAQGKTKRSARRIKDEILAPLISFSESRGGHIPEIFEGAPPHHAVGAPCQAWSLAELARVLSIVSPKRHWLIEWLVKSL